MGSGTTLFECEELGRKYIGLDINPEMIDYVNSQVDLFTNEHEYFIGKCDSASESEVSECVERGLKQIGEESVQFVLMHPPYMDIVKFKEECCCFRRLQPSYRVSRHIATSFTAWWRCQIDERAF